MLKINKKTNINLYSTIDKENTYIYVQNIYIILNLFYIVFVNDQMYQIKDSRPHIRADRKEINDKFEMEETDHQRKDTKSRWRTYSSQSVYCPM